MIRKSLCIFFISLTIFNALAGSFDDFSINLYKSIAKSNADKNLVISPASIALSAGLALHGASGETREQIERALGGSDFGDLIRKIKNDASIESGNKIFVAKKFSLKETYQTTVEGIFESKAQSVDFGDSDGTSKIINDWVENQTHGLIKDLVKSLDADLAAILINAIYFKGAWVHPFSLKTEFPRDFHLTKTNKVQISFMDAGKKFNYADFRDKKVEVLELPYENTDISMVILLPREIDGLNDLEENLSMESLNLMLNQLRNQRTVEVMLPRFKIDFESGLNDGLKELGMNRMFTDEAEFDNLINEKGLKVGEVLHKAVIDVNENGTEAAAVTQWRLYPMCSTCGPAYLVADHPFLFFLKNQDFIFFMGRVVDPKYE